VRLFVALDIPQDVRTALKQCAAELSKICQAARWVRLDGAHITLKFIGEVPAERAEAIRLALAEIHGMAPVDLHFAGLGFFAHARRLAVLFARIETGPELGRLAAAVDKCLAPIGIASETRDFRPHLTLARFNSLQELQPLRDLIAKPGSPDFGRTTAREFCLYESVLKRSGAEYTRLATFNFCGDS
jgi:RNA 2',3'-cyclic 3'-phosphodiesterase